MGRSKVNSIDLMMISENERIEVWEYEGFSKYKIIVRYSELKPKNVFGFVSFPKFSEIIGYHR